MADLSVQHPRRTTLALETKALLSAHTLGGHLKHHATIDSTNVEAARMAALGAPEGTVISADFQEAGKGRLGRRWEGERGKNLLFSVVLRPPIPAERYPLITLAACVAVAETIEDFVSPVRPEIKWPNDVMIEGRKCCGTLLETNTLELAGGDRRSVIVGIGLNVNQIDFPPEIENTATSLRMVSGHALPRAFILARLLETLERRYFQLLDDDVELILAAYESRLSGRMQPVELRTTASGSFFSGTLIGIDKTGGLNLATAAGKMTFHAGEVTFSNLSLP